MINSEISAIFNEIADLLELKGENTFRIRAYRRAAQNIDSLAYDLSAMRPEDLSGIPGIGKDLAGKIQEYIQSRTIKAWEELKSEYPEGIRDLFSVPGLGPRTVKLLYDELGIASLDELEKLARAGKLRGLPHIKEKTESNILKGLDLVRKGKERMPLGRALPLAEEIVALIEKDAPIQKIAIAGSIRRRKESIRDIDIIVTSKDPLKTMEVFVNLPPVKGVIAKGKTKSSVELKQGIQVDLRVVDDDSYGAALLYFTGNKAHNIRIRELAVRKGLKVNEYGIFSDATEERLGGKTEEEMYRIIGMNYIEPVLREDSGEVEAALKGDIPRLIELDDIKGDLHVHSDWSDGSHPIEEIASAAKALGYEYLAVTDHSKGLGIANGLSGERILEQIEEIDRVNKRMKGIRILKGVEVDIRSDGKLDLNNDVLQKLDLVVASIHSGFRQSPAKLTGRLIGAMRNPLVTIIAHPTGRLIGEREAYELDLGQLFAVAARTGTALEINAHPSRLDLNDLNVREAKKCGVPLVICSDMHSTRDFGLMHYGISVAQRGWIEKKDVVNTMSLNALKKFLLKKNKNR